ncbi:hypothetical protein WME76_33635 [Sorangium sp. So ce119]|uniref:hypothetical protein n=1 Tax=Sorangium sp. So ce119 TaxID=3133279 RepID=UPI003F615EE8
MNPTSPVMAPRSADVSTTCTRTSSRISRPRPAPPLSREWPPSSRGSTPSRAALIRTAPGRSRATRRRSPSSRPAASTRAERKRLKGLVDTALGPTSVLPAATELPEAARRREALARLRGWFDEWSTTARAVVEKRGYLIRLGLANRKAPQRKAPSAPATPAGPVDDIDATVVE